MSPRVQLKPIDETIEVGSDETVLDAAFRQGYNLAYGCREGQCSACKCYLMEGEVALKPYSTFALSESEEANGYTLMCRAMPEEDLTIELLHFDPDAYKLENPIREAPTSSSRRCSRRANGTGRAATSRTSSTPISSRTTSPTPRSTCAGLRG